MAKKIRYNSVIFQPERPGGFGVQVFDNIRPKAGTIRRLRPGRAVNQRVKSVIEMVKKIEANSIAIEREKELRPSGRPLGRIALYPLFATKAP